MTRASFCCRFILIHRDIELLLQYIPKWLLQWYTQHSQETILPIITFSNQLLAETMSDMSNSLVPTNIQELFLPLFRVHSYGTRSSTSQNFYRKKSNLEIKKNSFSRLAAKLWNEIIPNKLRTLSKHKLKFNICLIYWRLAIPIMKQMKLFLKWRKQNQFFCNPAYKNSKLLFCFSFPLNSYKCIFFICFSS